MHDIYNIYNTNKKKLKWNPNTHYLCNICETIHTKNYNHCCNGCNDEYINSRENHCNKCHKTYKISQKMHNCNDHNDVSLFMPDIFRLNINIPNKNILNDNYIDVINDDMNDDINDDNLLIKKIINATYIFLKNYTDYTILNYINQNCNAFKKFKNGFLQTNYTINNLFSNNNYNLLFHGTSLINIPYIINNNLDISKRGSIHGQKFGMGEYFTNNLDTAKLYAKDNGAIIVFFVINYAKYITTHINNTHDTWYIIRNFHDVFFCCPVAVIKHKKNIEEYLR
jgi:hypothetical protein